MEFSKEFTERGTGEWKCHAINLSNDMRLVTSKYDKSLILPSAKCKPGLQGWIKSSSGIRKHRIVSMALYELVSLYMNISVIRQIFLNS